MNTPTRKEELLSNYDRTLDSIKREEIGFDMRLYWNGENLAENGICGTSACIFGHAVFGCLSGWEILEVDRHEEWDTAGQKLLGLEDHAATLLASDTRNNCTKRQAIAELQYLRSLIAEGPDADPPKLGKGAVENAQEAAGYCRLCNRRDRCYCG